MVNVNLPGPLLMVMKILTILALLLDFCTDCIFLAHTGDWDIHSGIEPKSYNHWNIGANIGFYINISVLAWMLISLFLAIVDILSLVGVNAFQEFAQSLIKAIIILALGIAELGVVADLGIAAGSITIILGVVWVILGIMPLL